ncbi:MAG: GAF domain-containing sensor histidine kinase, partial [Caldilineaceae bacterium]|nr:GAF domain-containing sensor histidine kinase [Caldilineaceae bacterium]
MIRELVILNEIAQALNRSVDLNAALQSTLAQVATHLDLQTGWIWLRNERNGQFYLAAAQNLPPALADSPARMEGSCWCLDCFSDGTMADAANIDIITCTRLKNLAKGTDGLRYHATVPLYAHGHEVGVLNVASTDWRELSDGDLRLLYTVGDLLGIAVERARLYERSMEVGAVEERNRLAREIHDTLAQGLSAIALQLEAADALIEGNSAGEQARQAIQQALHLTRTNLDEARRSVLDLRAAPLEGKTLAEALTALVKQCKERQPTLRLRFTVIGRNHPLPVAVEAGLYRVAQEALTNLLNHAHTDRAKMALVATPTLVTLTIEDQGRGFDQEASPSGRFGLTGMNERVKLLGGKLTIES